MRKLIIITSILIVIALFIWGAFSYKARSRETDVNSRIKVVTTLFPLFDLAKKIGADTAEVSLLLPPGVEAHSFEPRPSDIAKINEADIFIYTGKFMEPWVADILNSISNRDLIIVDASQGTTMIPGVFHDEDEPAGSLDPHIWLDFDNTKIMAINISKAFIKKNEAAALLYNEKLDAYNFELTDLDNKYKTVLTNCKSKEIIYGGHYAFGYLAHRYNLQYLAAQGISPDAEPSASDLAGLVEQIRKNNLKYVFYEELSSPKIAETIAQETKAKLLLLNAAHNLAKSQIDSGLSFFDIMKYNLDNLKIGLECE